MKADAERRMTVDWAQERQTTYPAGLQIETIDRVGVAHDVLKKISDMKINLVHLAVETSAEKKIASINVVIDVVDINQLNRVTQAISQISDVMRVQRKDHRRKVSTPKPSNVTPLNSQRKRNGGSGSNRREMKLE